MRRRAWLLGVLATLPFAVAGQGETLSRVAGLERHLVAWPEVVAVEQDRAISRIDLEDRLWLAREIDEVFAPESLLAGVLSGLPEADPSLVRGFVRSEAASLWGPAGGPGARELRDFPAFASLASSGGIPATRLALVARVDEAAGVTRMAWRVSTTVARAWARGTRALSCSGQPWDAPLDPAGGEELASLAAPFRERVMVALLFHAREKNGLQLQAAARFLETERARVFHRAFEAGVGAVLAEASSELARRVADDAAARCRH